MSRSDLTRRNLLQSAGALLFASALPAGAASRPSLHVLKDPSCGCCGAWITTMQSAGFDVSVQNASNAALFRYKLDNGISEDLASCHTGIVEGYLIEGHVPAADVLRLLADRPEAIGLSVPGMPYGAAGMAPESERDAYDVILIRKDGSGELFNSYAAA